MRKSGPLVGSSPALDARDHVAWCADNTAGFARLASQVAAEAPADEQVLIVAQLDDPDWDPAVHFADEIEAGRVLLADVGEAYRPVAEGAVDYRHRQLSEFATTLAEAQAAGFTGLRAVADNTAMLTGSDALVERWLDWEQCADRWLAGQPVVGICYFDRKQVPAVRLARIARLHPLDRGLEEPDVRMYHDADPADGTVSLVLDGVIEYFDQGEFRRRLRAEADAAAESAVTDLSVDLRGIEYMHHSGLVALNDMAASGPGGSSSGHVELHLSNVPSIVRRMHSLMPDIDHVSVG